jgi:hypothetical protein
MRFRLGLRFAGGRFFHSLLGRDQREKISNECRLPLAEAATQDVPSASEEALWGAFY